jgi:hypothetical protein
MGSDEHPTGASATGLTQFQLELARLFFDLPTSAGFLLAGAPRWPPST